MVRVVFSYGPSCLDVRADWCSLADRLVSVRVVRGPSCLVTRVVIRLKISIIGLKRTFYHPFILSYLSFHVIFNGDPSPISPQVASLYQPWLGKRLFSDKRL